jgi:hypothetical protein
MRAGGTDRCGLGGRTDAGRGDGPMRAEGTDRCGPGRRTDAGRWDGPMRAGGTDRCGPAGRTDAGWGEEPMRAAFCGGSREMAVGEEDQDRAGLMRGSGRGMVGGRLGRWRDGGVGVAPRA